MASRVLAIRVWIDWDFNGVYTNETAYLLSADGDMRLAPFGAGLAGSSGIVSTATITLRNVNGRFSPLRTDGALYAYLQNGRGYHAPCYIEVSIDGGVTYSRVFTGVLKLPHENTLTPGDAATVTFDARSIEENYLQRRVSLTQAQFSALHDAGGTEADAIAAFLDAAGVPSGQRSIDAGLFVMPWSWLDDESAIEECWSLAASCGGRFYGDPDGRLVYANMARWQTAPRSTTVQYTFSRDTLLNFALRLDDTDLHNVVTVEAAPRTTGGLDVIWEPETPPVLSPGESKLVTARYNAPAYSVSGVSYRARDYAGNDRTSAVSVSATYYAQRTDLTITNSGTLQVTVQPLRILGVPVVGGPEIEERRTSAANGTNAAYWSGRGERSLSIRGNAYVQSQAQAATLAQFLLDRCEYPRLIAYAKTPGVPGLRLGDRVQITDPVTMSATFTGYVISVRWSYAVGVFDQDIEIIQSAQLYPHDGNYFVIGTDVASGTRRLFY